MFQGINLDAIALCQDTFGVAHAYNNFLISTKLLFRYLEGIFFKNLKNLFAVATLVRTYSPPWHLHSIIFTLLAR